ncbi:MAG TPA: L,D-transpeptidase, partial [Mycobacterium sp.]|nr:L,D-transpeptidase [Mycobacterium sp.]
DHSTVGVLVGNRLATVLVGAAVAAATLTGCANAVDGHAARAIAALPAPNTSTAAPPVTTATPPPKPKPKPRPNHCAGNTLSQLVLVSVSQQHVWMCAGTRTVYESAVTTGAVDLPYDETPTGTFVIQAKETDRTLTLLSGAQYQVKYWIPFDAPLFGFHDAQWQDIPFGSQKYRTKGSHGCVHMPLKAMAFLYHWGQIGATVTIRA